MICVPSNLQVENIITRIKNNDMDLQPNFQRGEVWSKGKQQKLIDTILREWTVPPIHVVISDDGKEEVLDGQQRLVAIRDFVNDMFYIDGNIQPSNDKIKSLHKKHYSELPPEIRRRFLRYEISFITLKDYKPSEPAELFDRLNQPTKLTSAEQRNAYIGDTRNQVKSLAEEFEKSGANKDSIGFSNSRLAYDEIISKFCYAIELKTLRTKVIASDIANRYREDEKFSDESIKECSKILSCFMNVVKSKSVEYKFSFNKATIFSWFVFIKQQYNELSVDDLQKTMLTFEIIRDYLKGKNLPDCTTQYIEWFNKEKKSHAYIEVLMNTFNQRASIGSTDALSIIYRDIILYVFSQIVSESPNEILDTFETKVTDNVSSALDHIYSQYKWGEVF